MRLAFLFTSTNMLPSQQEGGISVNEDAGCFAWSRHTENSAHLNSHTVIQGVHCTSKACLGEGGHSDPDWGIFGKSCSPGEN